MEDRKINESDFENSLEYKILREIVNLNDDIANLISSISHKTDRIDIERSKANVMQDVSEEYIAKQLMEKEQDLGKLAEKVNSFHAKVLEFDDMKKGDILLSNKSKVEGWLTEMRIELTRSTLLFLRLRIEKLANSYWQYRDELETFLKSINKVFPECAEVKVYPNLTKEQNIIANQLRVDYKDMISSIRKFGSKFMMVALKLDSIMLKANEPPVEFNTNVAEDGKSYLDLLLDEMQEEIDEMLGFILKIGIILNSFQAAKKQADAANLKIAHVVPVQTIIVDVEALHNAKEAISIAKIKCQRIIGDNRLSQDSKAMNLLRNLAGSKIVQEMINDIVAILQQEETP